MSREKVVAEIRATTVEFNGKPIDGIEATCTQCGHVETSGGTSSRSVKRCLAMMRENCPEGENNFYVEDD